MYGLRELQHTHKITKKSLIYDLSRIPEGRTPEDLLKQLYETGSVDILSDDGEVVTITPDRDNELQEE